eukprot:8998146-Ditylum_brightwellii.AAC.1
MQAPRKKICNIRKKQIKCTFDATKVRAIAKCSSCGATCCIFSVKALGGSDEDAPSAEHLQSLDQLIKNNGFICGNKIKRHNKKLFNQQAVLCGDPIEANYYNPNIGTKGGRIIMEDICAICYVNADTISTDEMIANHNLGGKTPLSICRGYYDAGVETPFSGSRKNIQQAQKHRKRSKKRQSNEAVNSGHKKVPVIS